MIVLKKPKEGAVFLTENPLPIEIKSTLGADYYFKIEVFVDDELFDILGGSKINDTDCFIDLTSMFTHLFKPEFDQILMTTLKRRSDLMKKIKVVIKEFDRSQDKEVNAVELPFFYVILSKNKGTFNHLNSLIKLSESSQNIRITKSSYRIPFWFSGGDLSIKIISGIKVFFEKEYTNLEKGIFEFDVLLSEFKLKEKFLRIIIETDSKSIEFSLTFKTDYFYPVSEIYFLNSFHIYEYCEFFGGVAVEEGFKRKEYELENGVKSIANVTVNSRVKINAGFLLPGEEKIVKGLNSSSRVYWKYENQFIKCNPVSKKAKGFTTLSDYQEDTIELEVSEQPDIDNSFNYDDHVHQYRPPVAFTSNVGYLNKLVTKFDVSIISLSILGGPPSFEITIYGTGSSDPQNFPISYNWEVLSDPNGTVSGRFKSLNNEQSVVKFRRSSYAEGLEGIYTLRLTVTNSVGLSNSLDFKVNVKK